MRGRMLGIWCAIAILLVTFGGNNSPGEDKPPIPVARPQSPEGRIREVLMKPVTLDFSKKPLKEIVEAIAKKSDLNIQIDSAAVREKGIDTATPVTLHLKDISLHSGLKWLLQPLKLTYIIVDECVLITDPDDGVRMMPLKLYAIRDLAASKGEFGETSHDVDAVGQMLLNVVQPTTWDNGTQYLPSHANLLAIVQKQEVHEQIGHLFAALRETRAAQLKTPGTAPVLSVCSPTVKSAHARIENHLALALDVDFNKLPLDEVIDALREKLFINFIVDKNALTDANIALDQPVTFKSERTLARTILSQLFRENRLHYVICDEVVFITTQQKSEQIGEMRVYPCADLIPKIDPLSDNYDGDLSNFVETLRALCRQATRDTLGGNGQITGFGQPEVLVVWQTRKGHEEIARLLDDFRAKQAENARRNPEQTPAPNDKITKIFRLRNESGGENLSADQVADIVKETLGEKVWGEEGAFMRAAKTIPTVTVTKSPDGTESTATKSPPSYTLTVRHNRRVLYEVCRVLTELGVWSIPITGPALRHNGVPPNSEPRANAVPEQVPSKLQEGGASF